MNEKNKKNWLLSLDWRAGLPPPSFEGLTPARLVMPSNGLPRGNKVEMELRIATEFLNSISAGQMLNITNIRTNNPNDPPDILFDLNGSTFGVELCELTPVNRLERNHILDHLGKTIITNLQLSDITKDWVIVISLDTDDSRKVRARGLDNQITKLLSDFFSSKSMKLDRYNVLNLPNNRGVIFLYKADLSDEPRIKEENAPLITFMGYNTIIYPNEDVPEIVEKTLREKFSIITPTISWLLLWSEHMSLASLDNEILQAISQFCSQHSHHYEKIIYRSLYNNQYAVITFD